MRRFYLFSLAAVLLLVILSTGCAGAPTPNAPALAPTLPPSPTATSQPTAEPTIDYANQLEDFDPSNFDDPTNIDNQWLPMQPGIQLVLDGVTEEAGNRIPHQITFTVTGLTKEINGVKTVVAYIVDFSNNQPVEREIAFYAQDNDGNVWYLGEYPEVYEFEKIVEAPAWIAGLKGAKAGIKMKADPQLNTPSYSQGWGPAVNWTDRGKVAQMGQQVCVPVDCYEDVLVIEETSREESGAYQLKYYAAGVGNMRVGWRGADASREELEMIEYNQLSPEALAEIHTEVLEQEERGYELSKEVYAKTPPMEVPEGAMSAAEPAPGSTTQDAAPERVFEDFDPGNFGDPTNIDNPWLPMQPGTHWVFEGITVEDGEEIAHRIEFTATDLTKEIDGVRTVVAWVLDFSDDQLVEKELAFYAQDDDGNVWYLGEHPEEYEEGEFVQAPTWLSGLEEAKAGIKMWADPQAGTPAYFQGWGPAVEWTDYGQIDQTGQEMCVPVDCYEDVLAIAESSLDETNAFQLKYYASGVGNIGVGWRGEDATQEELELVEYVQLDPEALAEVRALALELEGHAYEVSPDVYGQTPPAESP